PGPARRPHELRQVRGAEVAQHHPGRKDQGGMMSEGKKELPADLVKFRDSYVELFGTLPPLPAARFEFSGEVNPEFLRVSEQLRAGAFYSKHIDVKTTQLILFGMLLAEHNPVGAAAHAAAARRAGASWEELHTVM